MVRNVLGDSTGCAAATEGRDERGGDGSLGAVGDGTKPRSCDRQRCLTDVWSRGSDFRSECATLRQQLFFHFTK